MANRSTMHYINIRDGSEVEAPLTDETALLIIPEMGGHGVFKILREHGASIEESVLCVLHMQCRDTALANEIFVKYGLAPLERNDKVTS